MIDDYPVQLLQFCAKNGKAFGPFLLTRNPLLNKPFLFDLTVNPLERTFQNKEVLFNGEWRRKTRFDLRETADKSADLTTVRHEGGRGCDSGCGRGGVN